MVCNKSLFSSATPETFYEIQSAWVADNDSIERHLISYYLYLQQQISDVYFKTFEDRVRKGHLTRAFYLTSCCSIKKHLIRTFSFWPFLCRRSRVEGEMQETEQKTERVRKMVRGVGANGVCSSVVWGSYLVLKYALMVAGDPFITGRKQKGVSLLI